MLRNTWIVLGAFAPISVFVITAFATEELQIPVTRHGESVGRVGAITWTVCSSGCDFTSIQTAVDAASDGDIIELGPETFYEAVRISVGQPSNLTIRGQSPSGTVIDGLGEESAFTIVRPTSLSSVTIRHAVWGVVANSDVTLNDLLIVENENGGIGVILEQGNEVVVTDSTIRDNTPGLGVYVTSMWSRPNGVLTLRESTVSGNAGGIVHFGVHDMIINIESSTIADNDYGGITLLGQGQVVVENSTVTGHDGVDVPAIDMAQGWLSLFGSTITDNYFGIVGEEGWINLWEMQGTIVANNPGGACSSPHYAPSLYNLVDDDSCGLAGPTNLTGKDPLLLPLADNGGPTPTHALAPGSPAIDSGDETCLPTDQRGVSRPQDGDGDGVARCDIGAYEYERPVLEVTLHVKPDGFPNSINPYSRGVIPVAVFGSETFDVADIDETSLGFGPSGASIAHRHAHFEDANLDGIMDLMTHFRTQDTGIACRDELATLTGETLDGQPIEGSDSIQTLGCRETRRPSIWMKSQDRLGKPRGDGPVNVERK